MTFEKGVRVCARARVEVRPTIHGGSPHILADRRTHARWPPA